MDILQELHSNSISFEQIGADEIKLVCPFHADTNPSLCLNITKGVYNCPVCKSKGSQVKLLSRLLNKPILDILAKYRSQRFVKPETIETLHNDIWRADKKPLYQHGINDDLIRYYRIGWDGRFTIPIKNNEGKYINIRRYSPGVAKYKMISQRGRGKNTLFPIEQMYYPDVLITGGELKAIIAAYQLNKYNIGAVSCTAGEQSWPIELLETLEGKQNVYVCMDVDPIGIEAANEFCLRASIFTEAKLHIIKLPLSTRDYPKGDINDFVHYESGQLIDLIQSNDTEIRQEWSHSLADKIKKEAEDAQPIDITEIITTLPQDSRADFTASLLAKEDEQYVLYSQYSYNCDKHQPCCSLCPLYTASPGKILSLDKESKGLLQCISQPEYKRSHALKEVFGVPNMCKSVTLKPSKESETLRLSKVTLATPLSIKTIEKYSSDEALDLKIPAVIHYDNSALRCNVDYHLKGRLVTDKTAEAVMLCSYAEECADSLDEIELDQLEELGIFNPTNLTLNGINEKIVEIHNDLSNNVTHIYGRLGMHVAMDLAYHSVIGYFNQNDKLTKGWIETLILGDRGEGKSQAINELMNHYGLGVKVDCKNSTFAGLMGGVQHIGTSSKWSTTWGTLPRNDKRLVVLEELKELAERSFSQMTDTRSSGILNIQKISGGRVPCRVRLICISNPKAVELREYTYGVLAIRDLIGRLEDIRRFDLFKVIDERQTVPNDRVNYEHKYTSELCKRLLLWVWSRKPDQIMFETGFFSTAKELTQELGAKYSSRIPLFDAKTGHEKVERIAIAVAARLFNATPDFQCLFVTKDHARFAAHMLNSMFSDPDLGYKEYSQAQFRKDRSMHRLNGHAVVDIGTLLLGTSWNEKEFINFMLEQDTFDTMTLRECFGYDSTVTSTMIRKNLLVPFERGRYVKSPEFSLFLRQHHSDKIEKKGKG